MKRDIAGVIVHCSASPSWTTLEDIDKWHKERGWRGCGYHFVVESDGLIRQGRGADEVGAHCEGHNEDTLGICLVGGIDSKGKMHKFSKAQFESLELLLTGVVNTYGRVEIHGHKYYNKYKECPCFEIEEVIQCDMSKKGYAHLLEGD